MASNKRRKVDRENRTFTESWTEQYFFIMFGDKPLCLLCNATVAVVKECNLKRHYTTKHSEKFDSIIGEERKVKINSLRGSLCKQQDIFTKQDTESANSTCASFAISEIIGRKMKPFTDGEFVKECLLTAVDFVCPEKKSLIANISLSARTVTRRIEDLSADVKLSLKELTRQFEFFAIALDESTDLKDTAQVAVFIRGINAHFDITEEFASLVPLRDTTTGLNIFNAVKSVIDDFGLKLDDLCGVTTDGAPAMTGTVNGAVSLIEKEMRNVGIERNLVRTHCIIHLEALCAKSLRMQEVMRVVVKTVNFVRSRGLNHRQFQQLMEEIDSQYGDLLYYCEVRWLSRGAMLERVYQLRNELTTFVREKGLEVPEFSDSKWLSDFAFLVDITNHLNSLNLKLQGKNQLVNVLYEHVCAFQAKLRLWEFQLKQQNCAHFPTLNANQPIDVTYYSTFISDLSVQFDIRFADVEKYQREFSYFASPFDVNYIEAPEEMQLELIELQNSVELKSRYRDLSLVEFYQKYLTNDKFPVLRKHAKTIAVLFGSTYVCEQLFSRMKYAKNKLRTRLKDDHLETVMRLSTSTISPDVIRLSKDGQHQKSH